MHTKVIHNCYSPRETAELCSRSGVDRANMRLDKIFFSSALAGALLAFACACTLSTNTSPWYQDNAPGLIRMIGAIIFPFGLVLIVLTGADLVTGSFMFTTMSVLHRRLSITKMLMHWFITFWGNLAGSLFVMAILAGYGGVFSVSPFIDEVFAFNDKKVVDPDWHMIFLRGIGCNWLVCLACYLAYSARELISKVVAIWWPVFAFVCVGFDHVVANMFFVPMAIFLGSPTISVSFYIWKSLIPALIGNLIGGGFFVGVVYWYMYLAGQGPIAIDGELWEGEVPLFGKAPANSIFVTEAESPTRQSSEEKKDSDNMV